MAPRLRTIQLTRFGTRKSGSILKAARYVMTLRRLSDSATSIAPRMLAPAGGKKMRFPIKGEAPVLRRVHEN